MLFTKSTKFREIDNISWEKAKSITTEGLSDCSGTWCSKYAIDKLVLIEWKGKFIYKVDQKIKIFSNKTSSYI